LKRGTGGTLIVFVGETTGTEGSEKGGDIPDFCVDGKKGDVKGILGKGWGVDSKKKRTPVSFSN